MLSPDKNPNDDSAHQKFLQINEAYSILGNALKRKEYDAQFREVKSQQMEWSTRSYRESIRPDDWILYRRPGAKSPGFNYKSHQQGHYPEREEKNRRFYKNQFYKGLYEEQRISHVVPKIVVLVGTLAFLLNYEYIAMLWH
ncbi:hypothetical protein HK103_006705 [Boothiomyces macroporosus]|uniref:J domain-containing protein n=1 Tax=Boothiomyces macroporosus TaxID=261099 RepID=A0AAD5UHG3_9FUNG|nr:hypothetical protein HK103_006705 [Boothiomyces macroporosus]